MRLRGHCPGVSAIPFVAFIFSAIVLPLDTLMQVTSQNAPQQHSLEQVASIERSLHKDHLTWDEAMFVADQLVVHGSAKAPEFLRKCREHMNHPHALHHIDGLTKRASFIRNIAGLDEILIDPTLCSNLYDVDGFFFSRGETHPEKLLIVFTTMFNNFYVSNTVLYAIVRQFGLSVLFLKDPSLFIFLNGVSGFGSNIERIAQNITRLTQRERISELYVTGFSSGGYASLFASCLLPCSGYMGFSIMSDLSEGSKLNPGKHFTRAIRNKIRKQYLVNLRTLLVKERRTVKRHLYVAENHIIDREHAENIGDLPGVAVNLIPDSTHQTIATLIENGSFVDVFQRLWAD